MRPAPPRALDAAHQPAEREFKFVLDEAARARLEAAGFVHETAATAPLRSVYWDTSEGDLLAARVALRVRCTPDGWVQTVKGEGDSPFERFEWEAPVGSESPERAGLPPEQMPVGAIVHRHFDRLAPVFATDFERSTWQLRPTSTLTIELAADRGRIVAGERSEPIAELEAEHRGGAEVAFYHWALRFATQHDLKLAYASKNERGLRLAQRLPALSTAVKAQPHGSRADVTAAAAAARAVKECIAHFTANIEPLRTGTSQEAVHQARVALRRLRAVLKFFELPAHDRGWKQVDALARQLAETLGRLRDADVFADGVFEPLRASLQGDSAIESVDRALVQWRERERAAVREAVTGRDATRLVLASLHLAERAKRTVRQAADSDDLRAVAFGEFGALRIAALAHKLDARARRAGEQADEPADARWHRTRIAAKNLRYALEFSVEALPKPKRTRAALRRLAKLQQRLGATHDGTMASTVVARALADCPNSAATATRAAALVDGWMAHARIQAGDAEPARAKRAVDRVGHALRAVRARAHELRDAQSDSPTSTSSPTTRTG